MTATDGLVGSPSSDAETFTHAAEPLLLIQPDGADCSDGLFCNGAEQCVDGVCQASAAPCPLVCDEVGDQCLDSRCPPVAQSGCLTADTSVLVIKNNADNNKDKLIWKWLKGQPTMLDDFGDPQSDADYAWCLYGGVSEALLAGGTIDVPASATKWSPLGTGLKYDDPGATADGAEQLTLKSSTQNRSKAKLKGRGTLLPDPTLPVANPNLPLVVQLLNSATPTCLESRFTSSDIRRNAIDRLKAKAQ